VAKIADFGLSRQIKYKDGNCFTKREAINTYKILNNSTTSWILIVGSSTSKMDGG